MEKFKGKILRNKNLKLKIILVKTNFKEDRFCQIGIIAAKEAFNDAGLYSDIDKKRLGVVMGNGVGE